ncbi:extracellular matrix regulator RemB [Bacillus sp. NPDC077027]|uniref:extracellular matrix regulator RemB n=1 Tax=Bacillus sp. NPDC077027 TaxID=3390548 RepID=UPI003CFBC4ED
MYIHLGDDCVVSTREIVAIVDYKMKTSSVVEEFLQKQKSHLISLSHGTPKSIVVTTKSIYYSPLSSSTLKKRASFVIEIDV